MSRLHGDSESQRVKDQFMNLDDFETLLNQASKYATGSKERDFVDGLIEKFDRFKGNMYLSEAQSRWLCDIAMRI